MMLRAYSIFDNKALVYNPPFFAPTNGAAVRIMADTANDMSTSIGRHPNDYILYCVGHYDDSNGMMTPYSPLEHVIDAVSLVTIKPKGDLFTNGGAERMTPVEIVKGLKVEV